MIAFTVLNCFIVYLAIISKQKRTFAWVMLAYIFGYLLYLYGDRLTDELPFRVSIIMILNRSLLLIPIFLIVYVTKKFNVTINNYWRKPNWQARISFPFIYKGFCSFSIRIFLLLAISGTVISFTPLILKASFPFTISFFVFLILFSLISGILEEILWRGVLLTRMVELVGNNGAIVFSSLAFGLSHLAFGYSLLACLGFALSGAFYAGIVIRSGSMIPAIILHLVFNILLVTSGLIPYFE